MPKRLSTKSPDALDHLADYVIDGSVIKIEVAYRGKNPAAVALGRLGGMKGGKARAAKLSAEERSAIARRAAQARWGSK